MMIIYKRMKPKLLNFMITELLTKPRNHGIK